MTASESYARRMAHVAALLGAFRAALDGHASRQAANPKHWGYAGDLEAVIDNLADATAFLSGATTAEIKEITK